MKTDLSKLQINTPDGSILEFNFAKELSSCIFQNTQSIEEHAFCMDLYKNPEIEITEENKQIILKYTNEYFKAFVKVAIAELLND